MSGPFGASVRPLWRTVVIISVLLSAPHCGGSGGGGATGTANRNPIAQDDTFNVREGTTNNTLTVLANNGSGADSDPDGDPINVTSASAPSRGGTATPNGARTGITYNPPPGFTGTETFTYTIGDGRGGSASGTVMVTILPAGGANRNPIAQDDAFGIDEGTTNNSLAVLADNGHGFDSDPDGDPINVTSASAPNRGGTATPNGARAGITYSPSPGFSGTETFTYTIDDGRGGSAIATVTVAVLSSAGATGPFLQESTSTMVAMEAESFDANVSRGAHQWIRQTNPTSGFSGTGAMQAIPNIGTNLNANYTNTAPQLDYRVRFVSTGTHYVWARGRAQGGGSDSLHVGLDGQEIASSSAVILPVGSSYGWTGGVAKTLEIASSGVHTINVWMREDGAVFDKLMLTKDDSFTPTGEGPPESPRTSPCSIYPSTAILSPRSGHLQGSTTLLVETLTCFLPQLHNGWGVRFLLDGGPALVDVTAPYSATFSNVALAEHSIEAQVVDASGAAVDGTETRDNESPIGIGDYYVAMGDSITLGVDDDIASDDASADGRNDGGGFPPILNNVLTDALGYPHTVENEGIAGITSAEGLVALPAIRMRHPHAQRWLVNFGMNDARPFLPIPSGLGLSPGDPGYAGSFKANVQQIVDAINGAGQQAVLAKINIALGDGAETTPPYPDPDTGARSVLIKEFNLVIDELVAIPANNVLVSPPDFYTYFQSNYTTEYADNIHPNGLGYQSMATLWGEVLVP